MNTPHWDERDTTKTLKGEDGDYHPLTKRAWEERFQYAVERLGGMDGIPFNSDGTVRKTTVSRGRLPREVLLERYKDVVMVRLSDGHEEALVTPKDFSDKHGMSTQGISMLLNNPDRIQAYGWTTKDRMK